MEYMSGSWYWWYYYSEDQCGLALKCSSCKTLGTGGVTILMVSVGWWCSAVHIRLLVLVIYYIDGQ